MLEPDERLFDALLALLAGRELARGWLALALPPVLGAENELALSLDGAGVGVV